MKQKIGTLVDETLMRKVRRRAVEEGRSLSDLIQDALVDYLRHDLSSPAERKAAYQTFCGWSTKISKVQLRQLLEEDMWSS